MMHTTRLRQANPLRGVEVTESSTYASSPVREYVLLLSHGLVCVAFELL